MIKPSWTVPPSFPRRARRRPAGLLPAVAAALAVVLPAAAGTAAAQAASTCSFDAAAAKVSIGYAGVGTLARLSRTPAGAIQLDGVACGAATVTNTDAIEATGGVGLQTFVVDLAGGALAPGKTAETDGVSEIEISVDAAYGGEFPQGDELRVAGTAGSDVVRFGLAGAFLDADADADVTTTSVEAWAADGKGGDDRLRGDGNGLGSAAATTNLRLYGGDGADELMGGDRDDTLDGGPGNDDENGANGTDTFRQGALANGSDVLDGGGSPYDRIDYTQRTGAVRIDLDGVADDGAAGELDNVKDTFEYLDGGAGADTIVGSTTRYQPFRIAGNDGDDDITGGSNYDELVGGPGNDTLTGNGGSDTFRAGTGNDVERGGEGGDVFYEDDLANGADDVSGGVGADHFFAAERTTAMVVTANDDLPNDGAAREGDNVRSDVENVTTGKAADKITGNALANTLSGGPGNDAVSGGDGEDVAYGGAGEDKVYGDAGNDQVYGYEDADVVRGGLGDDEVRGGYGNDRLDGGAGADKVIGDQGDDVIKEAYTKDAGDVLTGGEGRDEVSYAARTSRVTVTLDGIANDGSQTAPAEVDNVSAEKVTGGTNADQLTGSSNADELIGNGGADVLAGGDGADWVYGGDGADRIEGDGGDDAIAGGLGADRLTGGDGSDVADYQAREEDLDVTLNAVADDGAAGEGDDVRTENVRGGLGGDRLTGDDGANRLDGGWGDDTLDGGRGADVLTGADGGDIATYASRTSGVVVTLDGVADDGATGEGDQVATTVENVEGGSGADRLTGGAGADGLRGGEGDDVLDGRGGADVLDGEGGRDTADYASRTTALVVTADWTADDGEDTDADGDADEGDIVTVDTEVLAGGSGDDRLTGGPHDDELRGGPGHDTLAGGNGGHDVFAGGDGIDAVTYRDRPAGADLRVTIDGFPDDGLADGSEHDNVRTDVENLEGGAGDDELVGSSRDNVLSGGPAGRDELWGVDGNDRLDESAQPADPQNDGDQLFGGAGRDLADYSNRTSDLAISINDAADDGAKGDGTTAIENDNIHTDVEDVTGGSGNDNLFGSGKDNRIDGRAGGDFIVGYSGHDTLSGGNDLDRIRGESGNDRIEGGASNNVLDGGTGNDTFVEAGAWVGNDGFRGGGGFDTVDYSERMQRVVLDNDGATGDDGMDADFNGTPEERDTIGTDVEQLKGGSGDDLLTNRVEKLDTSDSCEKVLRGGPGNDVLAGLGTRETMFGDAGNDRLDAAGGRDYLVGGKGDDVENGGDGDDTFIQADMSIGCNGMSWGYVSGSDGSDQLNGDDGVDHVEYRRLQDTNVTVRLDGLANDGAAGESDNARVENVTTGYGNDTIIGNAGANLLLSNNGNDHVEALAGDDRLWDGAGVDELYGGDDEDEFRTDDGDDADVLHGGDGDDHGQWDAGDTLFQVP